MAATYPGVVRPFTTKQNLIQDVDASHINDLQEEVVALETIVGINPHYDTGLFTVGVVQNRTTLSNRVKIAEAGTEHPIVSLGYVGTFNGWGTSEAAIPWTQELVDTHAAYSSGTTVTIPRDGYYSLSAQSYMQAPSSTISSVHVYLLRIFINTGSSAEVAGHETVYPANAGPDVRLSASIGAVALHKNDTVTVNYLNSSGVNRTLTRAAFQAAFLRGL